MNLTAFAYPLLMILGGLVGYLVFQASNPAVAILLLLVVLIGVLTLGALVMIAFMASLQGPRMG
jgi:hypothetical protein